MKHLLNLIVLTLLLSCSQKTLSDKEIKKYTLKGKEIGQATLQMLGSNLKQQMKLGGVKQAIPFCNVAANPLTEELSKTHNVIIKRTSHKLRNANNKPNIIEEAILKQYITSVLNNEKLKPIVQKDKAGKIHFYAPIKTQNKCLVCHGTVGKEVTQETNTTLKTLYPNDKAIGFKEGDLRGLMSITFN